MSKSRVIEQTFPSGTTRITVQGVCCPRCGGSANLSLEARPPESDFKYVQMVCSEKCQLAVFTIKLSIIDEVIPEDEFS
jgi:hypothetical protein